MKTIVNLFLFLGLVCVMTCQAQTNAKPSSSFTRLDRIVAIVNKDVITQSQLNTEIDHVKKQFEHTNQPLPPAGELRKNILDALIAKNLQKQICQEKGITASEDDINKAIQHIMAANKLDANAFKQALEQQGMTMDSYKAQLRDQITLQKLQQEAVAKNVTITTEDVNKFVRENKDKLNPYNAFHVIDVVLPISESTTPTQVSSLKTQASEVVKQLQKGQSVEEIMKQYPYAQNNDLGWRSLGELPSIFQSRVAAMTPKTVSAPIQAPNGFHVLKLLEAKGENAKLTGNDLKNLAYQQKVSIAIKEWTQSLRKDSYIKIMN